MPTSKIEVTAGTGTNIATHTITESAETRHLSRVVVSNSSGAELGLATTAKQDAIIAAIAAWSGLTDAQLRASAVPISAASLPLPSGAATNTKLDSLITAVEAVEDAIGTTVVPDADLDSSWTFPVQAIPSGTLTAGTTYWALTNTGTDPVYLTKLDLQLFFTGTDAASASLLTLVRTHTAAPTGGTSVSVAPPVLGPATPSVDLRHAPGGLTTGSVTFGTVVGNVGISNRLTTNIARVIDFANRPIKLAQNDGICIRANGTVVAGIHCIGSVSFYA
jgi:hypothetical protein